jgi:hypothetical protein
MKLNAVVFHLNDIGAHPVAVVGTVCAAAEDADVTVSPINIVATRDLNMAGFLNCLLRAPPHLNAAIRAAACILIDLD